MGTEVEVAAAAVRAAAEERLARAAEEPWAEEVTVARAAPVRAAAAVAEVVTAMAMAAAAAVAVARTVEGVR